MWVHERSRGHDGAVERIQPGRGEPATFAGVERRLDCGSPLAERNHALGQDLLTDLLGDLIGEADDRFHPLQLVAGLLPVMRRCSAAVRIVTGGKELR